MSRLWYFVGVGLHNPARSPMIDFGTMCIHAHTHDVNGCGLTWAPPPPRNYYNEHFRLWAKKRLRHFHHYYYFWLNLTPLSD